MLKGGLISLNFRQSQIDPCLFLRHDCIIVVYVDDCLVFARSSKIIDELLVKLREKFILTDEGSDVTSYLGLNVEHGSGTITLAQPALITRILKALDLDGESVKMHDTPATKVLQADENSDPRKHSWNYRSVIGMLMYLASSTRPEFFSPFINVPNSVLTQNEPMRKQLKESVDT